MRRRLLIAAILLLILAPFVLLGILLYTPGGLALIGGQLWRLERYGIHITGLSGTLSGPLRVEAFELKHPRVHIVVHEIVIQTQLRGLLVQTLQASSVTARDAVVKLQDADMPPSTKPPRFVPQFLRVDADNVVLNRVRYEQPNGMVIEAGRLQGRGTVTARTLRIRDGRVIDGRINEQPIDASGTLTLRAARPIGMEANGTGTLRMSNGVVFALDGNAKGNFDRLEFAAQLKQPQRATATAVMTRPDERWNIVGHVDAAAFALDPWLEKPPFSLRNVALDVQANPDRIGIAGNVGIPELDSQDLAVEASGSFAKRVLTIASADIALTDSPAKVHAQGTAILDGESPTLDIVASWQNLQWPLHGAATVRSATGEGTLRGPMPYDFTTTAQVDGPNLPPAQGSAQRCSDEGTTDHRAVRRQSVRWQRDWQRATAVRATPRLEAHDPRGRHQPGRASRRISGPHRRARAGGRQGLRQARELPSCADESARHATQRARACARDRAARWQDMAGQRGATHLRRRARDARRQVARHDRGATGRSVLRRSTVCCPALAGSYRIDGLGERRAQVAAHHRASCTPRIFAMKAGSRGNSNIDADVDAAGGNPSRLIRGCSTARSRRPLIDRLQVTGTGVATDHRIALDVTGFPPQPQLGAPHAVMDVAGRYDKEVWNATVTTTELSTGAANQQLKIPEPATVLASRDRAQLDNFCLVIGAGRMCAEGRWQRGGAWQGTVSGYEIPLASVLPPSGAEAEIAGRIEGRVHAFGAAGQPWQGEAGARIIDAAIIYRPPGAAPETLNLGTGGLAATATPRAHRVLVRYPGVHRHILVCERPAAARRPQRHHESAVDRRHAGARRGRKHPAAGVPGDRSCSRTVDGERDDRRHAGAARAERPHRARERRVRFLSRQPRAARAGRRRRPCEHGFALQRQGTRRRGATRGGWRADVERQRIQGSSCTCAARICSSPICRSIASSLRRTCTSWSTARAWTSRAT